MTDECRAYRSWHAREREYSRVYRELGSIEKRIDRLEQDMFQAMVRQYAEDKAFVRAILRYTGHTQYGFETACGSDGRLIKLTRRLGWTRMRRLIEAVRRYY